MRMRSAIQETWQYGEDEGKVLAGCRTYIYDNSNGLHSLSYMDMIKHVNAYHIRLFTFSDMTILYPLLVILVTLLSLYDLTI